MRSYFGLLAVGFLALPVHAAETPFSIALVGGTSSTLTEEEPGFKTDQKGNEIGFRAAFKTKFGIFLAAEGTHFTGDDTVSGIELKTKFDDYRIGGGYAYSPVRWLSVEPLAQYEQIKLNVKATYQGSSATAEAKATGYFAGGAISVAPADYFKVYAQAGHLSVKDDYDDQGYGADLRFGGEVRANSHFSGFAEYRRTTLRFGDVHYKLTTPNVGIRFSF